MKTFKHLSLLILCSLIMACGSNSKEKINEFSIQTNAKKNDKTKMLSIKNDETLSLEIVNQKNHTITSVNYSINGKDISNTLDLKDVKLGVQTIKADVVYEQGTESISQNIMILNNASPKVYSYSIINEYPHDITSYTQGLEFHDGVLYESTGQYNESKLRKVDYQTGEVLQNVDLSNSYFGEGLTILNDKIYVLTWQEGTGLVYDINSFKKTSSFKYGKSKEGWGICNDGSQLYKSDGSDKIWTLNTETLVEEDYIQTYTNKGKIIGINELEWVNGKIYANRYQKNGVAIINPKNGAIEGVIDFSPLKNKVTQHNGLDVLNGIAYNPETNTIFVTGKRWDKLFEVEIITE